MLWLVLVSVVGLLAYSATRHPDIAITVTGDRLRVRLHGWDALLCLRRRIEVPLHQVRGVAVDTVDHIPETGFRVPGAAIPGWLQAGSYGLGDERSFWDIRRAKSVLRIELDPDCGYCRLVLQVPDPHAEALRLRPTLGAWIPEP